MLGQALGAALAAATMVVGSMLFAAAPPATAPDGRPPGDDFGGDRGQVGALLHSRWLHPDAAVPLGQLSDWARAQGLEVLPVGLPLTDRAARDAAPATLRAWLALTPDIASFPSFNTFALPAEQQTAAGLQAFFGRVAPAAAAPNVLAVAGANEPLTKGKQWPSVADAEARVRAEYEAWHAVSDAPLCHKFTGPKINVAGADWAFMERLWTEAQDAICYDWYASNGDTLATLDHLRELGQRLGKPVHILEVAVPGDDPRTLQAMAERVDSVSVYQWLASPGGEDEKLSCYVVQGGTLQARPPAGMLRAVLQGPA